MKNYFEILWTKLKRYETLYPLLHILEYKEGRLVRKKKLFRIYKGDTCMTQLMYVKK